LAYLVISILFICCLAIGFYLWLLLRQIKELGDQIKFLDGRQSRLRLTSELKNKQILELADQINRHIDNTHSLQISLLREESAAKDTIAGLSHDIRTPLTSLNGYLQLLQQTNDPEKQMQYLAIMEERINGLTRILDELFTYAKLEQDAFSLELQEINLSEVLAHNLFSFYEIFKQNQIEPKIELPVEDVKIKANPNALERVLQNVLQNALLHGAGNLKIKLDVINNYPVEEMLSDGNKLSKAENSMKVALLEFSNQLKPDSQLNIDNLFDKFYKADPARQNSSTGLGLSIAKRLLDKMDVEIKAKLEQNIFYLHMFFPLI
jgi:signal transduction histidine kinase